MCWRSVRGFVGGTSAALRAGPVGPTSTREKATQPARVLVVAEEQSLRALLRSLLAADGRFTSLEVEDAGSAMVAALGSGFDLCVVGLVDPAQRPAPVIAAITANAPQTKVLVRAPRSAIPSCSPRFERAPPATFPQGASPPGWRARLRACSPEGRS